MVIVKSGGEAFYLDGYIKKNLDTVKDSVLNNGFDYVSIVSGIPGVGKSTFAQQMAKYLDPTFNTKDRICFTGTGEKGLIERTSKAKAGQAFVLDESFESLNSRVTMSSEFIRIVSHLQLIRQKGLFIILLLPNFFDLSKGIAIFRSSHLFVVYTKKFKRGFVSAFDRDSKRKLYVLGNKFLDYNAVRANFNSTFVKKWVVDQKLYDKLKINHLTQQAQSPIKRTRHFDQRNNVIVYLKQNLKFSSKKISKISGLSVRAIDNMLQQHNEKTKKN